MKNVVIFLFLCWVPIVLNGQPNSIFSMMKQDTAVDLHILLDWKELEKKKAEKAYFPAHLKCTKNIVDSFSVDLKMRTRGHMRLGICSFPPLKLKFDKEELARRALSPHNEIDLVQHCHKGEQYDQFILREYLAYKLFQQLSPYSYQVQLARIHYRNPDGSLAHDPSVGFMVENSEELVDRLQGKRNKTAVMSQNALDRESLLKVCLFNYMIGNTDWYIKNRHNLEFVLIPGYSLLISIPFDFDYSGLVAAPYAAHHESIKLPSVTNRYYQGRCESEEMVSKIMNEFVEKKEAFLKLCNQIPGMTQQSIKHTQGYVQEFFDIIESPKKRQNFIFEHCDMWPVATTSLTR